MERMMKKHFDSMKVKVSIVATTVMLAISLSGCNDPIVSDMEAKHQRLGNMAMQELQQCPSAYPTASQTETLFPAE
jgi:hypothetical protein